MQDTLGFRTSASDTYYFVIENPSGGFLGIGAKNVGIFDASAVATWQEVVTKTRTETRMEPRTITKTRMEKKVELRPVEKERMVEDFRTVQKQKSVSLFEYLATRNNP
ncbi:MAG: hypothetical protein FJ358_06200 [Thaumarchaeota archaeon]|nr:hypothetical protein [Nitrososphaerota archaeon]